MLNATITFRGKCRDGLIQIPTLTRTHCDMQAFRIHPRYGPYANSDFFPSVLARIRREVFGEKLYVRVNEPLPEGVTVKAGFLHTVTLEV